MKKLLQLAKTAVKQEIVYDVSKYDVSQIVDWESGAWRCCDRMPDSHYWADVESYSSKDLIVEQDPEGRIVIVRITRKGTPLGRLGKRDLFAREEMWDIRRFTLREDTSGENTK